MFDAGKSWWRIFGKYNFAFFYRLVQGISLNWGRKFLYIGLEDKSIYEDCYSDPILNTSLLGKTFPSPIGVAAGFDTTFKYNDELMHYGFGFEEFGTITAAPEKCPVKLHYLSSQKGIFVDESCFNNPGVKYAQKALIDRRHFPYVAGLSISSNVEASEEGQANQLIFERIEKELVEIVQRTAPYCDYIVLNLSHPNLPISNLLLNGSMLESFVIRLKEVIHKIAPISNPRLLVKVPLDISSANIPLLCESFIASGVDGVIVGGYLNARRLNRQVVRQYFPGYVCGRPIKDATTQLVGQFYSILQGRIPIIASGGVFTASDAFEQIKAGASLVQIHSAIIYTGPGIANRINSGLADLLKKNGYRCVSEAVGRKFPSRKE